MKKLEIRRDAARRRWGYCPVCGARGELYHDRYGSQVFRCGDDPRHDFAGIKETHFVGLNRKRDFIVQSASLTNELL